MKKIICNICYKTLVEDHHEHLFFKVKITSPFIDVSNTTVHCCPDCYDKMMDFFNLGEADK